MGKILSCAAMVAMLLLAWSADGAVPAKKKATTKKSAAVRRTPVKQTAAKKSVSRGKKAPAKRTTWRNRQLAPTAERYKDIQEALVAKGFLRSEDATGAWNQTSMDALKKFQAEQNLESTGKINALSLIALGLGPKHDTVAKPSD